MNANATPFDALPAPQDPTRDLEALARLLEGLGFRLRWACEGLTEEDCAAEPIPGTWSIGQQIAHVVVLVRFGRRALEDGQAPWEGEDPAYNHPMGYMDALTEISKTIDLLRAHPERLGTSTLSAGPDHVFPAAYLVNGPWADALTHVGQIIVLRKAIGKPAPAVQPFLGQRH